LKIYLLDDRVLSFYKALFFVRKLKSIHECILVVSQFTSYLLENPDHNEHVSFDALILPIKNYISEYVTELIDGMPVISISNQIEFLKNDNRTPIQPHEFGIEFIRKSTIISQNRKLIENQLNQAYINQIKQNLIACDSLLNNMDIFK
jgi:hypothetical protein